jgi:hypothetical protein
VQVEALSRQVKQLEAALTMTTRDYILGARRCIRGAAAHTAVA